MSVVSKRALMRRILAGDVARKYRPVDLATRMGIEARPRVVSLSAPIARSTPPQDLSGQVERVSDGASAVDHPDPWDRLLYDEWVERLGADRMRVFLAQLLDQFLDLRVLAVACETNARRDDMHRRAHDASSTAGTLGFLDVMATCRALLEAPSPADEARVRPALIEALGRAIHRLDRHLSSDASRAVAA